MRSRLCLVLALLAGFAGAPAAVLAQAGKPATPPPAAPASELIDINTADKAMLMTLDGIGDVRSDAIIKGRPYRAKNELADKGIIPDAVYDKIKDRIIARQPPPKPARK
ncbi:MAG: helix-hairpin-helix domain-containing protein [Alphaproteobacteria bacterium]|nr:helix-hairpin-helix domain-containing protein [Alphaproteobacteria bacterium]MCW5741139.1 helix-hairpin-helix domain-containing protein [Alphaproteobacteria bacterium]